MSRSRDIADAGVKINYLDNVGADINTTYAPLASPTFTGTTDISSGATFPTGTILNTTHKYVVKDRLSTATRSWQTGETHTNIITNLTNGNKLRVSLDSFRLLPQAGSYTYFMLSVFPNGTTDSLSTATGKKILCSSYISSASQVVAGSLTVEITVAASAYDAILYLMTEDTTHTATIADGGEDANGADTQTLHSGTYTTGASLYCYEIKG